MSRQKPIVMYTVCMESDGARIGFFRRLNYLRRVESPLVDEASLRLSKDARQDSFSADEPFSLLVWNVHKGGGRHRWRLRKSDAAFREVQRLSPDLALLQEYQDGSSVVPADFFADHDATMAVSFFSKPAGRLPTGVLSRSRVASQSEQSFTSAHTEITRTPKTALFTTYAIANSDEKMGVFNIHGINLVGSEKFQHFLNQLDHHASSHVGPLLFAGDFNTWSTKRVAMVNTIMSNHGLREVSLPGATSRKRRIKTLIRRLGFSRKASSSDSSSNADLALDRVYVRGLDVKAASVLPSTASDHKPLLLTLAFQSSSTT